MLPEKEPAQEIKTKKVRDEDVKAEEGRIGTNFRLVSLRIAGIYFILGCLWILFSDEAASWFVSDVEMLKTVSIIKGWLYILTTAVLLYYLVGNSFKRIKRAESKLLRSYNQLKKYRDTLHHLAYHDYLTSLNNKLALFEKSAQCLPGKADKHAIFFIDIFNFKYINDTLGHSSGDKVIIKVSERLSLLTDEKRILYRLDGDEFVIIQRIEHRNEAEEFAGRILDVFKDRFEIDRNNIINVYLSIGIALCPEHGNNINELLKYADEAMYKAKKEGRNRYVFYDQVMHRDFIERLEIQKYLLTALEKNEFELYYQPQVDQGDQMKNIEALIRWNSPELGKVPPHKFIEIAEDSNEIIAIGKWVLNEACKFLKSLHLQGHTDLTVSVNISIQQLIQTDFVDTIIAAINQAQLEPRHLELEITETILMESFVNISNRLKKLREHGVRIALDDFGKGYSSLGYLNQLPITTIKIDKLFVDDLASEKNRNITGQIVRLGKSMGLRVVAEGVENREQKDYLIENECDYFQGEIFSGAVSATEIAKMLNIVHKKH